MPNYNDLISRSDNTAIEIPTQVANDVIQNVEEKSVIGQLARRVTMGSKSYRQPVLTVLPNAYWVQGDTGLKQTTKAEWDSVELTAEAMAVLVVVPDELIDDAMIPIWTEVKPLIAEAFGRKLDNAAIWGLDKPASWGESIYQQAAAAGNYVEIGQNFVSPATSSDLGEDIATMGEQLANDGFDLDALAISRGFQWKLQRMRNKDGSPIYTNLVGDQRNGLYGVPFVESRNGAWNQEVKAIGGDWSKAIWGLRQDMTFTMSNSAVITDDSGNVVFNAYQQDSKIMRVVARYGFAIANPVTNQNTVEAARSPFSLLVDNNTVGS